MGTRISQLPLVGTTSDADTMVVVQSGITSQVGVGDFIDLVETAYDSKIAEYDGLFADLSWVRDFIYPVGSFYTQYPDANSNTDADEFPAAQRPETLFGGTWVSQWDTESIYFRTGGTAAADGRVNGSQADQMQLITGGLSTIDAAGIGFSRADGSVSGVFSVGSSSKGSSPSSTGTVGRNILFSSANSPNAKVSSATTGETRVVNRRIKVWKRTA